MVLSLFSLIICYLYVYFGEMSIQSLFLLKHCLFIIECKSCLYILDTNLLSDKGFCKHLLLFCVLYISSSSFFKNLYLRICFHWFLEREKEGERNIDWLLPLCDWWGIEPATVWCTGGSIKLSHQARASFYFFRKPDFKWCTKEKGHRISMGTKA